ncbi:uncharacterized protein LOC131641678 [Vicia villosa]|uniref:uncharacterized protein LOC131641678 n=1 Tax=Vicia villosa TaxID=3911 RepID=UPI00273BE072|nr:uncharacterized protein LOC131641678 [Vicia villosa]
MAVAEAGSSKDAGWCWKPAADLFHNSSSCGFLWRELTDYLADFLPTEGIEDSFTWSCNNEGVFKEENLSHLLGGCLVISSIWRKVLEWFGPIDNLDLEEFEGFFGFFEKVKFKAKKIIVMVIWLATVWNIWLRRNALIFKNESFSFTECKSGIVHLSWNWLQSYYVIKDNCNFHIWNILPLNCFE